jgi:hypothetical protein
MSSGSYVEGWCKQCGDYSKNSAIATHGLCCACYHKTIVGTQKANHEKENRINQSSRQPKKELLDFGG